MSVELQRATLTTTAASGSLRTAHSGAEQIVQRILTVLLGLGLLKFPSLL